MKLNMNDIPTLQGLLSPEMYKAYTVMRRGGLLQFGTNDTVEQNEVTNEQEAKNNTIELLAFNVLRKAIYYTPVKTGKLRDSIYIRKYGASYEIGYTEDYAIYVHEIEYNTHKAPWQYKYLEDAAFEVLEEYYADTGIILPMTIQYSPLRVFIGEDNTPGEKIANIKLKGDLHRGNIEYYKSLLNNFMDFDINTASDSDKAYYEKMKDFFEYYRTYRKLSDWYIIDYWVDRNRHK